ncbi:hypothetical protein [uncultured Shewanella sp.]|uniref:hypothetical protein n=1 Tax=uncultured Shewanella sp. TaxID=173975 RepID=UPI002634755F|nr:hypothetical protein [uncultured Shewanella sp.]
MMTLPKDVSSTHQAFNYNVIETRVGKVLIRTQLIADILPLLEKFTTSLNTQRCKDDLLCWCVDVLTGDFEDEFGVYSEDCLEKLVLCCLNARHYLIENPHAFCEEFNAEKIGLKIDFDGAFHPSERLFWYDRSEFILMKEGV